jgi:hypothetical protein
LQGLVLICNKSGSSRRLTFKVAVRSSRSFSRSRFHVRAVIFPNTSNACSLADFSGVVWPLLNSAGMAA